MQTPLPHPLVLASSSPHRRQVLAKLGLPFETAVPDVDESPLAGETPERLALRLGLQKAQALQEKFPDALIIGSDQVALLNGRQLRKPGGADAAFEQLRRASGQCAEFMTSICVLDTASGQSRQDLDRTRVYFRRLDDALIRRYLEREQPYDCAGSFKSEGLGIALFQRLETEDPNALVGLPLIRLVRILEQFEVSVL